MGNEAKHQKNDLPKRAMILAAGLGERMRPMTDNKPKAMVEILGKPLIGYTLDWLAGLNIETIVVNLHYKPGPLRAYLEAHPLSEKIVLSDETDLILDTGGGVKKALPHFGGESFFVANCDAFFEPGGENPFLVLAKNYGGRGTLLLLEKTAAAGGYAGRGDFNLDDHGKIVRPEKGKSAEFVYTGLQVLDPRAFTAVPDKVFSMNRIFDLEIASGRLDGVFGPTWFHIGTPEAVLEVEASILGRSNS